MDSVYDILFKSRKLSEDELRELAMYVTTKQPEAWRAVQMIERLNGIEAAEAYLRGSTDEKLRRFADGLRGVFTDKEMREKPQTNVSFNAPFYNYGGTVTGGVEYVQPQNQTEQCKQNNFPPQSISMLPSLTTAEPSRVMSFTRTATM